MAIAVGDRYGPYTVAGDSADGSAYRCECKCGRTHLLPEGFLATFEEGDDCSCRKRRRPRKPDDDPIGETFVAGLADRAARRNIAFELTPAVLQRRWEEQGGRCHSTGLPLILGRSGSASVDRKDSSLGYLDGNVVWCHKDINMMKQSYSAEKFVWLCRHVADWSRRDAP